MLPSSQLGPRRDRLRFSTPRCETLAIGRSRAPVRESLTLGNFGSIMQREITILEGISSLRSVRKFKPDPVPEDKLRIILESASKAASGSNTQPWEFVVVRDAKIKTRLKEPMLRTWLERLAGGSRISQPMCDASDD